MNRTLVKRFVQLLLLAVLSAAVFVRTCDLRDSPPQAAERITWDKAREFEGERAIVHGPVVDTHFAERVRGRPTFLNLGKPYPDEQRFTVVIWEDVREEFPEPPEEKYKGRSVEVQGNIGIYDGSAQIVLRRPDDIRIADSGR